MTDQTKQQQKINKMYKTTRKGSTQEELLTTIKENNKLIDLQYKRINQLTLFILFLIFAIYTNTIGFDGLENQKAIITIIIILFIMYGFAIYHYIKFILLSLQIKKLKDLDYK